MFFSFMQKNPAMFYFLWKIYLNSENHGDLHRKFKIGA